MLTLEEAIKHCDDVAEENLNMVKDGLCCNNDQAQQCLECGKEHRQLAKWLKELEVKRRVLDGLEEAYREMDEWEFLEYCKELWG